MKKFNKKSLVTLICTALLLTFAVSGTVAYLIDSTGELVNTFTPVQVDTVINETLVAESKRNITVYNKDDQKNIPVYVRVAVAGNWVNAAGEIVAPWSPADLTLNSSWTEGSDGFYYYKNILAVNASTTPLFDSAITQDGMPAGADHLEVTVVHQSIQAQPAGAVEAAWSVTVAADGTISK